MSKKYKIKSKKQRMVDYEKKYSNISDDIYERLINYMNDVGFKEDEIQYLINRANKIRKNLYTESILINLYEIPEPSHRPRLNHKSTKVYVPNAKANSTYFKSYLREIGFDEVDLIVTPMKYDCKCYFPIPSAMNKYEKVLAEIGLLHPIYKDYDNLGKTYTDILNSTLILDDGLIYDGRVRKYYSFKPRIEIKITYDLAYTSKYIKKSISKSKRLNNFASFNNDDIDIL